MKISPSKEPRKVIALIQARMNSTRLPGKVLQKIGVHPMLWYVSERAGQSQILDEVIVATSDSPSDDAIVQYCSTKGISCFRGSESDVLDRFYGAAKKHHGDIIVRLTGDCPLIDPDVIDKVIGDFMKGDYDYASNIEGYSYPEGLDTEVFSFSALEKAWTEAHLAADREHVTPYIRQSGLFRKLRVNNEFDLSAENHHWSVDKESDFEFIKKIYKTFNNSPTIRFAEVLPVARDLRNTSPKSVLNEGYYRSLFENASIPPKKAKLFKKSHEWLERSRKVVPGCTQTFSKGYLQYVQGVSPVFLQRGKGALVWDVDGNEFVDYVQGLLANILGYANEEVTRAVTEQLSFGNSFSLSTPIEVILSEKLTELIPCAEMVRFGRNGSDVTTGAVRAARALTGRDKVAVCGYHGWQDWYIGSTTRNAGVPGVVRELTHTFVYNNLSSLEVLLKNNLGKFAAVVMEPMNFIEPTPGFLEGVKKLTQEHGALLIFDEMCSGFHLGLGGAQKRLGVTPDLACFGKALGNGYPISCVVGKREVMNIFDEIFFSFTLAGETSAIAAALIVIKSLENPEILAQMNYFGAQLKDGFNEMARLAGLEKQLECLGRPSWSLLKFRDSEGKDSLLVRSLFQQEMIKQGILQLVTHNMCSAHNASTTSRTLEAYANTFKVLAGYLNDKNPQRFLEGAPIQPVFKVRG